MGGIESDIYVSKRPSAGSVAAGACSRREFFRAVTTSLVVWQVEPFLSTLLGDRTLLAEGAKPSLWIFTVMLTPSAVPISRKSSPISRRT